jgi:hypothetical protein
MEFGSFYVMKREVYKCVKILDLTVYEFYSIGPNGRIRKLIKLNLVQRIPLIFTLELGKALAKNKIDVFSVTDNKDTEKILSSVTEVLIEFLHERHEALVLFEGSTSARTRLFQIWISKALDKYGDLISIEGRIGNRWHRFEKGVTFDAFLIKRKNTNP